MGLDAAGAEATAETDTGNVTVVLAVGRPKDSERASSTCMDEVYMRWVEGCSCSAGTAFVNVQLCDRPYDTLHLWTLYDVIYTCTALTEGEGLTYEDIRDHTNTELTASEHN